MRDIVRFFDKLEDKVRRVLSKRPIAYTLIGAVAVVLFWRGVWMVADGIPFLTGWVSIFISVGALLITGLFVSFFIGDHIIISGLKQEKKLSEKTEQEIEGEETTLKEVKSELKIIESTLEKIEKKVSK